MGNNQPQSNRGIQNRCVGNRGTATIEKKGDSQHYLPGEKEKYKYGILSLEMPSPSPLFDAIAYGFAPGSSEIHMDYWATSKEFKPLIDEIIKPVEQVPFGKKLRTVAVIGCTDKVKSSTKPYDDQKLRLKRAEEFKELIEKLLPYKYRNKIRIIAKPLPEEADESLKPADTSVARERSRAVGIKLIQTGSCNRLTPEHVFDYYSSLLKKKNCSSKLSKVDYLFITDAIKIVRSGGDGKYITVDLTKNAISTYFKYFNKIYKAIESGSETEKRKLGKANGIPYPCTTFVCTTASKVKWYTQMTEKRLKKEKPSLFKLPYKTELLEHKLAYIVLWNCKNNGSSEKAMSALQAVIKEFRAGYKFLSIGGGNVHRAMIGAMGGGKEMTSFPEREIQLWIDKNEKNRRSIYYAYDKAFKSK